MIIKETAVLKNTTIIVFVVSIKTLLSFKQNSVLNVMEVDGRILENIGLSDFLLTQHLKLYENYKKKLEEIREKLKNVSKEGNSSYSEYRELKLEEGFCIDAVKLHKLFFENLTIEAEENDNIKQKIMQDFTSFKKFEEEFKACAFSARGWVLLCYDKQDSKLHLYITDSHNQGGIWESIPILVFDMYEHAFMIDFGVDKAGYFDWFLKHINWNKVNERL